MIAGGVGFSTCILKDEIQQKILSYKLNTDNTVFQAELPLLERPLPGLLKQIIKLTFFLDNRSSINDLKGHRTKSKFVNGIKENPRLTEGLMGSPW
ncbi:hypothetical protein AVEN_236578-1 [Araneus ventricosus]|uniref:Uncharacterized protein n=1 Tax=Araneus ventricosus TaxID=182803 RepID=A0A4Y2IE60_ARAVE|nr:hypothetical protein AVEN_236578-1 [Araneus ventricosus]